MKKRVAALLLAVAMSASAMAVSAAEISHEEELTIELYDVAANYHGIQPGWYAKVIKDRLNLVLNIIAPQVSGDGDALYQTRTASGNLGDMLILDNADMQECIEVGLVADISEEIKDCPNLMKYWEQIEAFNADFDGIYAIPAEMNTNGPTEYVNIKVGSAARVPWDFYTEIGRPEFKTTDDLLQALKAMQDAHPTNANGDPAYGITMWKDWDGTSIENVNQLTKWYGQEVNGSVLLGSDNTIMDLTNKEGAYYKMLKFFFQANQLGIIDPDSATQDWNSACDKMRTKRTYLVWNNWMEGFTNSPEVGEAGANYMAIPIADQTIFQTSDPYYGNGRCFGIGSGLEGEARARAIEYLEWLASPEGLTIHHAGTEGLIYTVNEDGTYSLTEDGHNRFATDVAVPEELGGGTWNDGNEKVNMWLAGASDKNPVTGETYGSDQWAATLEKNNTRTLKEWKEIYGADDEVKYFKENGMLGTVAFVNKLLEIDTTDISLIRSECGNVVKDASWRAVFAADEAEFEAIWDEMCTQLVGFGWEELVAFDTAKYQVVIDERIAAAQ